LSAGGKKILERDKRKLIDICVSKLAEKGLLSVLKLASLLRVSDLKLLLSKREDVIRIGFKMVTTNEQNSQNSSEQVLDLLVLSRLSVTLVVIMVMVIIELIICILLIRFILLIKIIRILIGSFICLLICLLI
jgi:hypothetical protein